SYGTSTHELCSQDDVRGLQRFGERATFFRRVCLGVKGVLVNARDVGVAFQLDLGDLESFADLIDVYQGIRVHALRLKSGAAQASRERHGEAAGVCGAEQLFGVGPFSTLESGGERVTSL